MTLLVYAYCTGVYSSRRIERACHEDVAFRVITANTQPYFTTINEFRRVHRVHFQALFVEVLKLCRRAERVKLRHVAIDGTKVKANASKHKAMSYERMRREDRRLHEQVERLLGEAEAADAADDARHGAGVHSDEVETDARPGHAQSSSCDHRLSGRGGAKIPRRTSTISRNEGLDMSTRCLTVSGTGRAMLASTRPSSTTRCP